MDFGYISIKTHTNVLALHSCKFTLQVFGFEILINKMRAALFLFTLSVTFVLWTEVDAASVVSAGPISAADSEENYVRTTRNNSNDFNQSTATPKYEVKKYEPKVYGKTILTTLPDCYNLENPTPEEEIESLMCVLDDNIYLMQQTHEVNPEWIAWNSKNPMSHEAVYCLNMAFVDQKRQMCDILDEYYDDYYTVLQNLVEQHGIIGISELQMSDIYDRLEVYDLPTYGLEYEIADMLFTCMWDYYATNYIYNDSDSDSDTESANDDGSYYYYYYHDDNSLM